MPDSIVDRADVIELVDLTPEDPIARLNEGKVNLPDHAERAIEHFFARKSYLAIPNIRDLRGMRIILPPLPFTPLILPGQGGATI